MILSVVFNIVVSFDGLVRTTIKTDNHHLLQEMPRPHFQLAEKGAVSDHIETNSGKGKKTELL